MHVDHSHPIHDFYCRCRMCKPPLVGDANRSTERAVIGTTGLIVLAIVLFVVWCAR